MAILDSSNISVTNLYELYKKGFKPKLVDVGPAIQFDKMHAAWAENYPIDEVEPEQVIEDLGISEDDPIYVICRTGCKSMAAANKFADFGFKNVIKVQGGTLVWEASGLPVEKNLLH